MNGYSPVSLAVLPAAVPGVLANVICRRMSWTEVACQLANASQRDRLLAELAWHQLKAAQAVYLRDRAGQGERVESHPDPDTALLSTEAAAQLAGVQPRTIRRWFRAGHLKGMDTGAAIRVDPASLREFLESRVSGGGDRGQVAAA